MDRKKLATTGKKNWKNMDLEKIHAMDHAVKFYKLSQLHRFATVMGYSPSTGGLRASLQ